MRKIQRYGRATILIVIIVTILGLAVYGLISLINNLTKDNDVLDLNPSPGISEEPGVVPTHIEQNNDNEVNITPPLIENKEITVSYGISGLVITNPGENFNFTNRTGNNKLLVYLPGKTSKELGFKEVGTSDLVEGYSINEENDGIMISVDVSVPFTIVETRNDDQLIFKFAEQLNTAVLEYRNDLSRVYMNIQKARLSRESDSFIKHYTEIFDETTMTYTITIDKNLMPPLSDELLVFNDKILKSMEIVNKNNKIQLIFKVYERIVIYPNTRDYDAAFTFIKPKSSNTPLIVLDPGHGGIDGGTTSSDGSIIEKDIVLNMCAIIAERLIKNGFDVINLREEDIFLGLMERTDIANLALADAIVSVHVNSYTAEYVNGATTLYKTSGQLAEVIQNAVINKTGANDMGTVKMTDLSILNRAEMDSVIVETGFLTNEEEAKLLNGKDYQEKVANGIAEGIESYFKGEY